MKLPYVELSTSTRSVKFKLGLGAMMEIEKATGASFFEYMNAFQGTNISISDIMMLFDKSAKQYNHGWKTKDTETFLEEYVSENGFMELMNAMTDLFKTNFDFEENKAETETTEMVDGEAAEKK